MIKNSLQIFDDGNGDIKLKAFVRVGDMIPVEHNSYVNGACGDKNQDPCYTNFVDGELFLFMIYLFAPFKTTLERE